MMNKINDFYYAGVYADHRGYSVSLARINNVDDPGIIYLLSSVSSSIISIKAIAEEVELAIDSIDQPNDYLKNEKLVAVLTNPNHTLQGALFSHFKQKKHVNKCASKDIEQSLFVLSERLGSGKLIVKSSLAKDIQIDIQQTIVTEISAQIQSLIIISDNYHRFRSLGLPPSDGIYIRM